MVRRLMLIFGSIVLATIGFLGYLLWQAPSGPGGNKDVGRLTPSSMESGDTISGGIGAGKGIWIKQYDKDGNLSSILSAKKYVPRQNGNVVDVETPEAEFYLNGGRRIVLTGDKGVVNVEQRGGKAQSALSGGGGGDTAPTSGFLYNVIIKLYDPATPDRATLTLTTNNISFDNQTFKFATESFTDSYGQPIRADQVPVQIRGDDVDFDGKGLIVRYDDLNQRIATLQITHGDSMTIKNAAVLGKTAEKPTTRTSAVALSPSPGTPGEGRGEGSVSTTLPAKNSQSVSEIASANSKPASPPDGTLTLPSPGVPGEGKKKATTKVAASQPANGAPTSYRATFLDNVHITQGDAPLAEADVLAIDFFPDSGSKHGATTKPAAAASAARGTSRAATDAPVSATPLRSNAEAQREALASHAAATQPTTVASTSRPATKPTTSPATQPSPIIVHWTGTLRIVAIDQKTIVPLQPGDDAVSATGSPVVLHQPQGVVKCGSMLFQSHDNSVQLDTSNTVPAVTFVATDGQTTLTTQHVDYSDAKKLAVLTGASNLRMVQPKQGNQPATETIASWKDRCTAALFAGGSAVQQIDLTGDVDVQHPQMKMKSAALSLAFQKDAADTGKSDLHAITASGLVDCDLSSPLTPNRTLKGEKVTVGTTVSPTGQVQPASLDATGSVLATDGDQLITADTMHATLGPKATTRPTTLPTTRHAKHPTTNTVAGATQPTSNPIAIDAVADATELKFFHATGSVTLLSRDGKATAEDVTLNQEGGHQTIELHGKPASLTQQGRTITGPTISANPDAGLARVEGAGTLHAVETSMTKAAATPATTRPATRPASPTSRPIDMAWAGGANFDGPNNLVTIKDKIVIRTSDIDGTQRVATGDTLTVTLKPSPTTQPVKKPTTKPGGGSSPVAPNAFKDKIVSAVNLIGNVKVQSTLNTPAGDLLKRSLLQTDKLTINTDDGQQITSVDIPGPGQALIDDRKPSTKSATQPTGDGGATAIAWSKSFHLDEGAAPVATLTGDVHVHHDALTGPGQDSIDLTSSKVIVTFANQTKPTTTRPTMALATKPTTRTSTEPELNIKQIYAAAPVTFKARDLTLTAMALQYTPDDHMVLVSGTERSPAEWFDGNNRAKGQFQQVWYNAETQLVEKWTGITVQGGR